MKTKNTAKAAMLLICASFIVLNFTAIGAKSKYSNPPKKEKSHAKMAQIYFEVQQPSSSNLFVIIGRGSALSGTLNTYQLGCVNDTTDDAGTATGTYSYNSATGVMSLSGTVTPHNHAPFTVLGSPVEYSGEEINLSCGFN